MVDGGSPAVVAAQDRADELFSVHRDGAEPRVARQEAEERVSGVRLVQPDPIARRPDLDRAVEIGRQEFPDDDRHAGGVPTRAISFVIVRRFRPVPLPSSARSTFGQSGLFPIPLAHQR